MPQTRVVLFREDDGTVPLLEWLETLPRKVQDKCTVRLTRLAEMGHELRRPESDFLRDGIYELRIGLQGRNYRMLYGFQGKATVIVSHGIVKERQVPPIEIDRAIERMRKFMTDPARHSAQRIENE